MGTGKCLITAATDLATVPALVPVVVPAVVLVLVIVSVAVPVAVAAMVKATAAASEMPKAEAMGTAKPMVTVRAMPKVADTVLGLVVAPRWIKNLDTALDMVTDLVGVTGPGNSPGLGTR